MTISVEEIQRYPSDGRAYVCETVTQRSFFFVCDGDLLYGEISEESEPEGSGVKTERLQFLNHAPLKAVGPDDEVPNVEYYNLIRLTSASDDEELAAFVDICRTRAKNFEEEKQSFEDFFHALLALFQPLKEQSKRNAVGLFGELSVMELMTEKSPDTDFSARWQEAGASSKYDFSLPGGNVEVKSTLAPETLAKIKHAQLFNTDNNYLAYCSLEKNPSGECLLELIDRLENAANYFKTAKAAIALQQQLQRVSDADKNTRMSVSSISFYPAASICPFENVPNRITKLQYQLDLVDLPSVDIKAMLEDILTEH